jgi:CIC family chloride channel protein
VSRKTEHRLIIDSLILGIVGALSAQLFMLIIHACNRFFLSFIAHYHEPALASDGGSLSEGIGTYGLWLIPVVTTIGGLISGFLVYQFAPEAEGHGTDTAVKSFHRSAGYLRARVPFLKMIASGITIGSGGSAGREGPIALIASGVGSIYAGFRKRSEKERRTLVLIGMAAGLSAIFRSPVGSAIFAVEVLYGSMEFEAAALIYTLLASIVAFAINGLFVGWGSLFVVPQNVGISSIEEYVYYILLGGACGILSTLLPEIFYGVRDIFRAIPIPNHFKPAIGGFILGLIALALPQVLGGGYGWIQEAIDGNIALHLLIVLIFAKMIAFALTVSSGGSGGVFAPSLFVGAMTGGVLAHLFHQPPAGFAIVGMAAIFSGAAHVPIAALLMVTEMTGGYELLVPAALAVLVSFLLQERLSVNLKYNSLYEAQVPYRSDSPAHLEEHFQIAWDLINDKNVKLPESIGHIHLVSLIKSGVPINLTDSEKFILGELNPDSLLKGKKWSDRDSDILRNKSELIAVIRKGDILMPDADLRFKPKDQLLILAATEVTEKLQEILDPPSSSREGRLDETAPEPPQKSQS